MLTTIIIITASMTPYFAFGKATPRIFLGLNSSLLFSSDILYKIKKGRYNCSAQIFYFLITTQQYYFYGR